MSSCPSTRMPEWFEWVACSNGSSVEAECRVGRLLEPTESWVTECPSESIVWVVERLSCCVRWLPSVKRLRVEVEGRVLRGPSNLVAKWVVESLECSNAWVPKRLVVESWGQELECCEGRCQLSNVMCWLRVKHLSVESPVPNVVLVECFSRPSIGIFSRNR